MSEIERTTPFGMHRYALQYLNAGQDLYKLDPEGNAYHAPIYFLFSHGVELLFKTFLLGSGENINDIKKYGHKLHKAYKASTQYGFPKLNEEDEGLLGYLDDFHSSTQNRYIVTGARTLPKLDAVISLCGKIARPVREKAHACSGAKRWPDEFKPMEVNHDG